MSAIPENLDATKRKKLTLWGFTGVMCVIGVLDSTLPGRVQSWPGISYVLGPVLFTLFIYAWVLNDAKADGSVLTGKMSLLLLLIPVLGLPVYVIRNKTAKKMFTLLFGFIILVPPIFSYAFSRAAVEMALTK